MMSKNKKLSKKQKVFAVAFFSVLSAMFVSMTAFATSYSTTFSFTTDLQGDTRSYSGNNIVFTAYNAYQSGPSGKATDDSYYTVKLCRSTSFITSDYIGTANLPRVGTGTVTWTNVGPGNYYILLHKANDYYWEHCDNVVISN